MGQARLPVLQGHDLTQFLQAALQQPRDGRVRSAEAAGGFRERATLQMMQDDGLTLGVRQMRQRVGEAEDVLVADGTLARRRMRCGQHSFEPGR